MEITKEVAQERFPAISEYYMDALFRYSEQKIPTGGFLRGVLSNNLFEAINKYSTINKYSGGSFNELREIIYLIHNYMPSEHHGSINKVAAHLRGK